MKVAAGPYHFVYLKESFQGFDSLTFKSHKTAVTSKIVVHNEGSSSLIL